MQIYSTSCIINPQAQIKNVLVAPQSKLRAFARILGFLAITLQYIGKILFHRARYRSAIKYANFNYTRYVQQWAQKLNRVLGLKITVRGDLPEEGVLLVSNHRSYIDICAIGELVPVTFLAKREVSQWPLIGYGCSLVHVVFVDRSSAESREQSRNDVAERLLNNRSIVVFPEGTSFEGPGLLAFKPGIFRTAAKNRFPIMPVAIEYADSADTWIADDTFVRHFFQTFSKQQVRVSVTFGPVYKGDNPDELLKSSWEWIYSVLVAEKSEHAN